MTNASPHFGGLSDTAGAGTGNSTGTDITGTAYTQIVAATTYDWEGFNCQIFNASTSTSVERVLTIGLGTAANEFALMDGITISRESKLQAGGFSFYCPVKVPAGSRLAGKLSGTTGAFKIVLTGVGASPFGVPASGIGIAHGVGTNQGTAVDPGAAANTKGSWTQIVASTTYAYKYIMAFVGNNSNTAMTNSLSLFDIGVGAAASEYALVANQQFQGSTAGDMFVPGAFGPYPCDIPAGTRLSVRGQCSITDATDRVFDITLVGFP